MLLIFDIRVNFLKSRAKLGGCSSVQYHFNIFKRKKGKFKIQYGKSPVITE